MSDPLTPTTSSGKARVEPRFIEGDRVRLADEGIDEVLTGTVVGLRVISYYVLFDDGERIEIAVDDELLVPLNPAPKP